jgi:hypothetical protein
LPIAIALAPCASDQIEPDLIAGEQPANPSLCPAGKQHLVLAPTLELGPIEADKADAGVAVSDSIAVDAVGEGLSASCVLVSSSAVPMATALMRLPGDKRFDSALFLHVDAH